MSHRVEDLNLLRACLTWAAERYEDESEEQQWTRPFEEMRDNLESGRYQELTDKQRSWVRGVHERLFDEPQYENLFSSGKANLSEYGKTPTPEVLKVLPKKPPRRSQG